MKKKIRKLSSFIVARSLIGFGFTKRAKKKAKRGDCILSIYFHSPSKSLFEFCIKWLKKNEFQFLSQEDILLIANKIKAFPKGGVVITVDDGWLTNEENVVAIANKYKVPVTIFVSTEAVEKGNWWGSYIKSAKRKKLISYTSESLKRVPNEERKKIFHDVKSVLQLPREAMTLDQVKGIATSKYITLGSHTVSHPILINCDDEESYFELQASKEIIEKWINKKVDFFAYPNGDYSIREINYLKELGYTLAYCTKATYLTEDSLQNVYELPRFCIFENISKPEAICRILGIWQKFI